MAGPCVAVQHESWDFDFGRSELQVHLRSQRSDDVQSRGARYRGESVPERVAGKCVGDVIGSKAPGQSIYPVIQPTKGTVINLKIVGSPSYPQSSVYRR